MDSEKIFQKNLELWSKTCPKQAYMLPYVNCNHLRSGKTKKGEPDLIVSSPHGDYPMHAENGAVAEAKNWFKSLNLHHVPLVIVFGVGLGYYYEAIAEWLKKDSKRRLVFLEDDLAVIHKLLETEQGSQIIQDHQVHLLYFNDLKEEDLFEALYWNFAMTRMAVSALPSYLKHKAKGFIDLRHKIAFDAAMKNALVDEYMRYGASFYINFYPNMLCLPESYLGNKFFGQFPKIPAIICGAGPSLAKNIKVLGSLLDKALVFAGGSALNVLNAGGFQPHFGAGIDPNPMQFKRLSQNQGYEVPFFYRNRMFHHAFKTIHGPRLYITGSGGYDTAEYFEKQLKIAGEFLDEGHNVVNFCVEVANAMGCDPIIFAGMDLAFTGMHEYAPGVVEDASITQSAILDIEDEDAKAIQKPDIYGKPTYTLWKWVAESEWIGNYAKEHPFIRMINCTEGGLGFPGIENRSLKVVARDYLTRTYEFKNRIHGETQNSAIPHVTSAKIVKIMKNMEHSLQNVLNHFDVLMEDARKRIDGLKMSKGVPVQSGKAALAETELTEEIAYKHVIDIFNEMYARVLSGEAHDLRVKSLPDKQLQKKKLQLSIKKFQFLRDVALINKEIILRTFREKNKKWERDKIEVEVPKTKKGNYHFSKKRLIISDPELDIDFDEPFDPLLIPKHPKDGQQLENGHAIKVIFDSQWKMNEVAVVDAKGVLDGQSRLLYPDGRIKEETFYSKGKLHGPSNFYDPQGKCLATSWYYRGLQEGKSRWHYPSGDLYSLQRYRKGVWHGRQEFYYADGSVKTLMTYAHGVLVGDPILLREDGSVDRVSPEEMMMSE